MNDRAYHDAVAIITRLVEAGHTAYLAGGCVRDRLLGVKPKDYDIATSARPEEVKTLFKASRFVGEAFGVTLVKRPSGWIEVATFRKEWGYEDGRRPSKVEFTDAEHDAQRRDFTINALFEDPTRESGASRVIDYVDGVADLRAGVIRAVGAASERFGEDYLRMLRAVRFAARFGFALDEGTAGAIRQHASKLWRISRERIGQEAMAMLSAGGQGRAAVHLIENLALDGPMLDETPIGVRTSQFARSVDSRSTRTLVDGLRDDASYEARLAAWAMDRFGSCERMDKHDPATADDAREAARCIAEAARRTADAGVGARWRSALCLTNEQSQRFARILVLCGQAAGWADAGVARRKRMLADACWADVWMVLNAMAAVHAPAKRVVEPIGVEVEALLAGEVAPEAFLTGHDLIAQGLAPGPRFKRLLDGVYDAQLEDRVRSRDEALRWLSDAIAQRGDNQGRNEPAQ